MHSVCTKNYKNNSAKKIWAPKKQKPWKKLKFPKNRKKCHLEKKLKHRRNSENYENDSAKKKFEPPKNYKKTILQSKI